VKDPCWAITKLDESVGTVRPVTVKVRVAVPAVVPQVTAKEVVSCPAAMTAVAGAVAAAPVIARATVTDDPAGTSWPRDTLMFSVPPT
jgi:hypothetical protein